MKNWKLASQFQHEMHYRRNGWRNICLTKLSRQKGIPDCQLFTLLLIPGSRKIVIEPKKRNRKPKHGTSKQVMT